MEKGTLIQYFASLFLLFALANATVVRNLNELKPAEKPVLSENDQLWESYKASHERKYLTVEEENMRKALFLKSQEKVTKHNEAFARGEETYTMGINKFSDRTWEEKKALLGFRYQKRERNVKNEEHDYEKLPKSVDWVKAGYVTEVKNQGDCGSCYAFSATGSMEGQHFKATGELVSLSEQNLVDCSSKNGNGGCNGGLMDNCFKYVIERKGIDTEEKYAYHAVQAQKCHYKKKYVGANFTSFVDVENTEKDLQAAVATVGPVSVAIDVIDSFFDYKSGVYYDKSCSSDEHDLNHGVLAVGYGAEKKKAFWLVKNSWGPDWGDNGYVRMARNKKNNCGIADWASYPVV